MKKKSNVSKGLLLLFLLLVGITIFSFVIYTKSDNISNLRLIIQKLDENNVPYKFVSNKTIKIPVNNVKYIKIVRNIIINSELEIDNVSKLNNKITISLKYNSQYIGSIEFYGIKKKNVLPNDVNSDIPKNSFNSQNKICIILDDGGYGNKNIYKIVKYPEKIAVAILPFLKKSRQISRLVHNNGKEVMLHMPMEPKNYMKRKIRLFKNDLLSSMTSLQIEKNITKMLNNIDYVKGVNNHQGSGLTENAEKMYVILSMLARENLYFIDSLTSGKSVSYKIGKKIGLPVGKRDIFLDNKDEYNYIKNQMNKLIKISLNKGYAIGIGHVTRENTVKVLYDYINIFKKKNIKLVYPSELLTEIYNKEVI